MIPIKVLGHWAETRVLTRGGDLFVDIPAELIQLVEADHPGHGQKFGYQLMVERVAIAELFRDDLRWLDELYGRGASRATPEDPPAPPEGACIAEERRARRVGDLSAKRPYLSVTDVAAELGCSVSDVEALIESKQLPPPIRGGLISRAALDAYQRRRRGEPSPVRELPPTGELDDHAIRLRLIHDRLASAASGRVHEYPPEKLRQLVDDARFLSELLRREQMRSALIEIAEISNETDDDCDPE
jgi:hypothetical protein